MAEDFKFQLSVKLAGRAGSGTYADDMLNIRADSASEFLGALNSFLDEPQQDVVEAIAAVVSNLRAVSVAVSGLATVPDEAQSFAASPASNVAAVDPVPAPLQAAFAGLDRNCLHGARQFRQGTGAKGAWAALYCPLPQERKAEQCSPEWADKKKLV